jgi:PAS domain S-box-containing protein
MTATHTAGVDRLLQLSADLGRVDSAETAVDLAVRMVEAAFDSAAVVVWARDGERPTPVDASASASRTFGERPWSPPDELEDGRDDWAVGESDTELEGPLRSRILVPAGDGHALSIGSTQSEAFDSEETATARSIGGTLCATLDRLGAGDDPAGSPGAGARTRVARETTPEDVTALRDLHELTATVDDPDTVIEEMLELGSEYLGLETGLLLRGGDEQTVEAAVGTVGSHEPGTVIGSGETHEERFDEPSGTVLALADTGSTEHTDDPATHDGGAYIGAPILVGAGGYGRVCFRSTEPRDREFHRSEREFVALLAGHVGSAIQRQQHTAALRRHEQLLDTVGDPVYALDETGRFTFLNEAAKREFGYGEETLGEHVSVGMAGADIERVQAQISELVETDRGSATAQFDIETARGELRAVENHLALASGETVEGTVGVLRDVTEREERRRKLESFRRAIEDAADGVAILDDGEYVHVDNTHVEMYGFDSKADLLGDTWRRLYSEEEVERLEQEAFPALDAEGHWRGRVTGSRPDGTTFPARLSLTRVGDGRLVCTVRDETERLAQQRDLALKERAMDEAGVGIHITDPRQEGTPLVYVNERFEELTGYESGEALGRDLWSLTEPDPETLATLRGAVDAGESVSVEFRTDRPDGGTCDMALSMTPVHDGEGRPTHFIGVQRDITARKRREREKEAAVAVLERVYQVTTDPTLSFEEKVEGLLAAGREYLDLPNGFLTRIDTGEGAGTQTVVGASGSHELLQQGASCPLPQSYCRRTIDREGLMTLTNAVETGWEGDRAHETFGLETYIGGEVAADEDLYGTLCFASEQPREEPFTETEESFVRLLRRWASYEIERKRARAELTQQRDRLELVLAGTGTGIAEWDLETDAVTWDDTLVEMVGRDPTSIEEFVGYIHPEDRDRARRRLEAMLETGETLNSTFRMITGEGETIWIETQVTPVHEDDEPVRVLATGRDISERKQRERERRRNERRFESLFEDPEMLVGLLDTDGALLTANETAMAYVDGPREDIVGEPLCETPWWAHSESLQAEVREYVRRAAEGEYVDFTAAHPGPDGSSRQVRGTIRPVTDQSGSVESLVISSRDVTERRRQEQELRNRQRKLDLVLSNTDTSVVEIDLGTGAVFWDDRLDDNDIGSPETLDAFFEAIHPDDRERLQADIGATLQNGDRLDEEYRIEDVNGNRRWIASQAIPVDEDSERVVAIATDVTELKERERALAESQKRFELLLESVDEYAFLTVDLDGRVDTWNQGAENLFGYDAETAVGMSVTEFHPEAESAVADRLLQQASIAGESAHEGPRVRADGSTFYADVRYATLETDDSEFQGYAMVVRDMTEQRRQRRRTELFVEQSDDVVAILDPDGTVTYASGSAERVLGHDPAALVEQNIFDFVHPSDREKAMTELYDGLRGETETMQSECRFQSGNGEWRNVEADCRDMTDIDAIDGVLVYLRDVTEQKQRIRRLNAVFDGTFQFTGLLEPDGTVVEVNEAALEFGGLDRESVVGERFDTIRWWTHSDSVQENVGSALETAAEGEFVRYETDVRGAEGLRTIDFSAKPVTDEDGEVTLLVVEGRDITAKRQSRQHMQVIHRVMRHNMRNDLNKLRAWTDLLAEEDDPERRQEKLARIEPTLEKWERMINTVKQIRQALSARQTPEEGVDAARLVSDVVAASQSRHPAATVESMVAEMGPTPVPSRLRNALQELVDNAVQAGGSDTHVEVVLSRPDTNWVRIEVSDNGPGLPEMEAKVLETGEETQLDHGGGLGLWMVRVLVTGAGGDISVDATPEGTSVCLRLPLE